MSESAKLSVLIVDDEPSLRLALCANFLRHGWTIETAAGVQAALAALRLRHFDLVLCDVRMSDGDGFAVLAALQALTTQTALLFLTAFASVPEAVRAVRGGAVDYLTKPVCFDHLMTVARRTLADRTVQRGPSRQTAGVVGRSQALQTALARARAAAGTEADILIEAESGTGKELLARLIHGESARRDQPFVTLNCAALPEALLEGELFGCTREARTESAPAKLGKLELAQGGTLYLDEIQELPLSLQSQLLHVLQKRLVTRVGDGRPGPAHLRVIASASLRLDALVNRGLFRSDLFFHLNAIPLTLPPLRDRPEDLPLLAEHFAQSFAVSSGRSLPQLHPSFLDRLASYDWPGNVRELQNFMQRLLSLSSSPELTAACFDREHRPVHRIDAHPRRSISAAAEILSMDEIERTHLERTLAQVGGNRTRAAEILGISLRTMRNKIRQYDLPPRRYA